MCKILHDSEVDYPVLHELARLPYRQLSGAEAVPSTYPSETLKFTTADGKTRVLQGGVTLRSRPTRRSIDRFDDEVVATLEQAVRHFGDGRFVHRVPLTFTLPTQLGDTDNPATILAKATAVLARDTGVRLLRQNLPKSASERLREATLKDPLDIDAWIYLALAEARAGNDLQARSALEQAQALDPQDPLVNSVATQLTYLADPSSLGAFGQVERRELSNEYVEKAFGAIDRPARTAHTGIHENSAFENAEIAIKIWPDNAQAYVIRGLLFAKYYKSFDLAVQDYDKGIRLDPKNALALVSRAEAYAAKDNYDQAIADCDEAIRIDPNNPRVFYIRGNSYQSKKKSNYPRAITDYTEAIRLDPAYAEARKKRASISGWRGNYDIAIEDYTRLIASGDATYKDRAEVYVQAGDFDRAINDYNEVLRARPADASVMDLRGDAYRKKGDLDQAIADYTEAIRLEPNADFSYESRAEVWREKGDLDRGIADYTAAIQVGKRGWEKDYLRRAELWAEKGDLNRALEDYSEARRVDPTSYIARAKFWLGQGRFDRAVAEYTEVIRTDPASGYYNRAHLWRRYRNLDRAIADYTEAIKLAPGKGYYYENRAEVREEKGDISNALADYNEIIRIAPADGYYQRAQFWRRQGKLDQAIADLTEAARLKPTYWPYYSSRARVWKEKGDLEHAIADYAAAIRVDPENALPYNTRAEFWLERGDPDRAVADYDEAIRLGPDYDSYAGRAAAWEQKGELDRAIADSSEAIRRRPNSAAGAFKTRGDAYRKKGREDLAAADYRQAAKIYGDQGRAYFNANPWTGGGWRGQFTGASEFFFKSNQIDQNDYTTLWLYLARARTDKPFNVASVAAHLNTQAWPYPIIDFYLGKRGPEGVLSASANPAQDCEARFYVGEWYLLHSNTAEAKSMLRSAVESCPKRSDTYQGAAAELIRIEASGAR